MENIHCHPNTQETSTHSARPPPRRPPDISCNQMSWWNPAKHHLTVCHYSSGYPPNCLQCSRRYSKYGGISAARSPSALGLTWQLRQASFKLYKIQFQFRIQHHQETHILNITPIWSTLSKTYSDTDSEKKNGSGLTSPVPKTGAPHGCVLSPNIIHPLYLWPINYRTCNTRTTQSF